MSRNIKPFQFITAADIENMDIDISKIKISQFATAIQSKRYCHFSGIIRISRYTHSFIEILINP